MLGLIPQNYQEWRYCIEVKCGLPLHRIYCEQRIQALSVKNDYETKKFIQCYGESHYQAVLNWFQLALKQAKP